MKKISTKIFCAILSLTGTISAFALDINGKAPTFDGSNQAVVNQFNSEISSAFNNALNELRNETGSIDTKPEDFIQSWGNSAVFASHGATTRAYGEYKIFSFTIGPMLGIQLPGDPFKIVDELGNLPEKLNNDRDIKLGISPQIFNARIGINTSKFLLDKLYLGLHLGFIKFNGDDFGLDVLNGFNYDNFSLGITANYQLIRQKQLVAGLLLWRGVNVGSGLIYQSTKIGYGIKLDSYTQDFTITNNSTPMNMKLIIDPKIELDMDISTVTIPLEATTAVKLLWFLNIPLGVGVDLGFGKSDIKIGMNGDINIEGSYSSLNLSQSKPGSISTTAGGDMAPAFFNLKFMTGLGFNFGPVVLDIPITFYVGNGYNVGVTLCVVF